MAQALRFTYYPGMPRPNPETNSPRAILLWERSKREYEEREARKRIELEQYARRRQQNPETLDDFRHQEMDAAARRERERRLEAEAEAEAAQQQQEERERRTQRAARAAECFQLFWESTTAVERTKWLVQYAIATGLADGHSGSGFRTQAASDRTLASLNRISNCPEHYKVRYRQIRHINDPVPPPPTPEQRMASARQALLGITS